MFKYTAKKGLETSLMESKSKYKVAHWIQEVARSLTSFKLSGRTQLAMFKNDLHTTDYLEARESHFKILVIQFIQMIGFKILVTAGLLVIGGLLVLNQQMNIGQFVAAEIIILLVISSVEKLIAGLESFYDVLTSLEKIGQIVDKDLEKQSGERPFSNNRDIHLELDGIKYRSPTGKGILNNINFQIHKNDRILLKGASGSGKTTLLKILSGLVEPTNGALYINETSIKGIWPNKYRAYIGQVLPEQTPFEGSILENITFGKNNVPQEHLYNVLKIVGLFSFIKEQPKGLNTIIYPEGQQIPYSVSKRIVLARAIIHNPRLLLLKDPLDHFEEEEAKRIIEYLTSPERDWALVVASRNGIWKENCNSIIELKNGEIITKK